MDDFPSNDILLHEVLATLKEHPSGLDAAALNEAVAVRTGHEGLLRGSDADRKILVEGVAFCVAILVREGLAASSKRHLRRRATSTKGHVHATARGLNASPEQVDEAWQNELAEDDLSWLEQWGKNLSD